MTRRIDTRTAELVDIALLTHAAFERERGLRFAHIAGVPTEVIDRIFARTPGSYRLAQSSGSTLPSSERRKSPRPG